MAEKIRRSRVGADTQDFRTIGCKAGGFEDGERIRIYTAYPGKKGINVREGILMAYRQSTILGGKARGKAMCLRVLAKGTLEEDDSGEVRVTNKGKGVDVKGNLDQVKDVSSVYDKDFLLSNIYGAERI